MATLTIYLTNSEDRPTLSCPDGEGGFWALVVARWVAGVSLVVSEDPTPLALPYLGHVACPDAPTLLAQIENQEAR